MKMCSRRVFAVGVVFHLLDPIAASGAAQTIARVWNEQALAAIRIDSPHPPVQARNLFHVSVAMYDGWTAYDPVGTGCVFRGKIAANNVAAARRETISHAAYRLLRERYALSRSAAKTLAMLDAQMAALGYDAGNVSTNPATPAGLGNLVAAMVSSTFLHDGARQADKYLDLPHSKGGYGSKNPALVVASSGAIVVDVNRWQPLAIENALDQNGFPVGPVQSFLGSQCLGVRPFALTRQDSTRPWIDPGPQPRFGGPGDAQFRTEAVEVIGLGSQLDPADGVVIDISPGAMGNNSLGTNDGRGHKLNPATGKPYAPYRVPRGDFARVLAEFWADGPHSETPPGHWNVLANQVADHPATIKRVGGAGPAVDDLEWDVKVYFALNAALHDAACEAWSLKRYYDGGRPIQFIRYMAQWGQSSDKSQPSYHPNGLPLVPGMIEVVNRFTAQPGGRHAGLGVGQMAVLSWPGQPSDPTNQASGVKWIWGANWIPYQKKTFVTPAFPGYVSGHSTFSRSGAEVMTAITGSPFFPGGLATFTAPSNTFLSFEKGPSQTVQLQWATYFDASDQAGLSRLYGGIHVPVDDVTGRKLGAQCGRSAWALAKRFFAGEKMK